MPATGVYTDVYREKLAQLSADALADQTKLDMPILFFKVGEGGFETQPNGQQTPKVPDPSRTDLEAPSEMGSNDPRNPLGGFFVKQLTPQQVSIQGRDVTISCVLSANEANLDGSSKLLGNVQGTPKLFEVGIFDGNPVTREATMLAYCTFDEVVKIPDIQVTINITIKY